MSGRCATAVGRLQPLIGGPDSTYAWDREATILPDLQETLGFLYQHLPKLQRAGVELWPMDPATLFFHWRRGLAHPYGELIVVTVRTWDASNKGVAFLMCTQPGKALRLEGMQFEVVSTIVTFKRTPEAQVHREAAGAPMAMRLLRRHFDLQGRTVVLRNDCDPVMHALRNGSPSQQLQEASEQVCKEAMAAGTRVFCLHVLSTQLIAEEVDGGSREGAERLLGP